MAQIQPIPKDLHTVTPNLVLKDCARAIEFYRRAFGAEEVMRMPTPDGRHIWHAELRIGDSILYLADELPDGPLRAPTQAAPAPVSIQLYVKDCDALFGRAVKAGAIQVSAPQDTFWGDRMGAVADPFGYRWSVATHVRDVSARDMERAVDELRRHAGGKTDVAAQGAWRAAEDEESESMHR